MVSFSSLDEVSLSSILSEILCFAHLELVARLNSGTGCDDEVEELEVRSERSSTTPNVTSESLTYTVCVALAHSIHL